MFPTNFKNTIVFVFKNITGTICKKKMRQKKGERDAIKSPASGIPMSDFLNQYQNLSDIRTLFFQVECRILSSSNQSS